MLENLREVYDYILLDLPPVAEVSDAMTAAKLTDGMLLVARQNYGNHPALSATVREFEFVGAKILGVVYNCTQESGGRYNRYYYKRYHRYYSRYGGSKYAPKYASKYATNMPYSMPKGQQVDKGESAENTAEEPENGSVNE